MIPPSIDELIDSYFEGTLNEEGLAELERWLQASRSHRRYFVRRAAFQQYIEQDARNLVLQPEQAEADGDPVEKFDRLLAALEARSGETQLRHLDPDELSPRQQPNKNGRGRPAERRVPPSSPTHTTLSLAGVQIGRGVGGLKVRNLIAAILVLGVSIGLYTWFAEHDEPDVAVQPQPEDPPEPDLSPVVWGQLVALSGEARAEDRPPAKPGETMMSGRWSLLSGYMQIQTPQGASVLIQAPSRFNLTREGAVALDRGRLTANVPQEAIGFTVVTPAMRVIDLGTEFGVEVDGEGKTRAAVFTGLVELQSTPEEHPDRPETLRLQQGYQSVLRPGQALADTLSPVEDDQIPFIRDWWQAMYQPEVEEHCIFLRHPPGPILPRLYESDTTCLMILEASGVELDQDVPGVIQEVKDRSATIEKHSRSPLPAGTRFDSYLVHFDPTASGSQQPDGVQIETTIRFPRPVVGLILDNQALLNTDQWVDGRGYGTDAYKAVTSRVRLGLEDKPIEHADYVALSEDRRSLTLKLSSIEIDQVRVWIKPAPEDLPVSLGE